MLDLKYFSKKWASRMFDGERSVLSTHLELLGYVLCISLTLSLKKTFIHLQANSPEHLSGGAKVRSHHKPRQREFSLAWICDLFLFSLALNHF